MYYSVSDVCMLEEDIAFLMYICMYVCVCVCVCMYVCICSDIFSETTGTVESKFHVEPPWDSGRKFIQMVQSIRCSSLLSISGGGF